MAKSYDYERTVSANYLTFPTLDEMGVAPEILDIVDELVDPIEGPISRSSLEGVLRLAFFLHQNPDKIVYQAA